MINMQKKSIKTNQSGVSIISILAFLALLVFSLNFIVRIFAFHWDDRLLVSILDDLPKAITSDTKARDIERLLQKRLEINRLKIPTNELVVTKKKGKISLLWQYERREHVMSNVDVLLTFNHEYSY